MTPELGQVMLYWNGGEPLASIVSYVWSEKMVNLAVFSANGGTFGATSIPVFQPGEKPSVGRFAEYPPEAH